MKDKAWDNADPQVKKSAMKYFAEVAAEVEYELAIEVICHKIEDLEKRIEKLEKDQK